MTSRAVRRSKPVIAAAVAAIAVAALGALATDLGPWYQGLRKPAWMPPDWLFGPAWTLIFGSAALSGIIAWNSTADASRRRRLLVLFAVNGVLNVLWSAFFFRVQRPDWALIEVAFLWLSILLLILYLATWSRQSAWLLAPYLLWVTFAAALTAAVARLNAPFAGR